MNPYLQIAREHLTTEELEMLLAERKKPVPKKMTAEEEFDLEIEEALKKLI